MKLTGLTRLRYHNIKRTFRPDELVLVMQVEYYNHDSDFSPTRTLWRDARVEDLTMLVTAGYLNLRMPS